MQLEENINKYTHTHIHKGKKKKLQPDQARKEYKAANVTCTSSQSSREVKAGLTASSLRPASPARATERLSQPKINK